MQISKRLLAMKVLWLVGGGGKPLSYLFFLKSLAYIAFICGRYGMSYLSDFLDTVSQSLIPAGYSQSQISDWKP